MVAPCLSSGSDREERRCTRRSEIKGKATLTAEEFDELRPKLGRLALDTVDIARTVLVDGLRPSEAAVRHNMSRQRVHGIVQRFRAAAHEVPKGWRRVEIWLPPEMALQVEEMARQARKDYVANSMDNRAGVT
jgi:hypothetical protein